MPTAEELMAPMIRRRLYVIISTVREGKDLRPRLADHLQYLLSLEAQDKVFASGPFVGEDGQSRGDGMTIVRAGSVDEAEEIARNDPFVVGGLRDFVVRPWNLMEGRIGLTADLSRGTFKFL